MRSSTKAKLRALRDELLGAEAEPDDAKSEAEEGDVSWPLEADEPEVELSHPGRFEAG